MNSWFVDRAVAFRRSCRPTGWWFSIRTVVRAVSLCVLGGWLTGCDHLGRSGVNITASRPDYVIAEPWAKSAHEIEIQLTNPFEHAAELVRFNTSCRCGAPEFEKQEFAPQETKTIPISLEGISLARTDPDGGTVRLLPVFRRRDADVERDGNAFRVGFSLTPPATVGASRVSISPDGTRPITVTLADPQLGIGRIEAPEWLEARKVSVSRDDVREIELELGEDWSVEDSGGTVSIAIVDTNTNDARAVGRVQFQVHAATISDVRLVPDFYEVTAEPRTVRALVMHRGAGRDNLELERFQPPEVLEVTDVEFDAESQELRFTYSGREVDFEQRPAKAVATFRDPDTGRLAETVLMFYGFESEEK